MIKADRLGDATAADVLEGKTFTSQNGLKLTGSMKPTNGSLSDKWLQTLPFTFYDFDYDEYYHIYDNTLVDMYGSGDISVIVAYVCGDFISFDLIMCGDGPNKGHEVPGNIISTHIDGYMCIFLNPSTTGNDEYLPGNLRLRASITQNGGVRFRVYRPDRECVGFTSSNICGSIYAAALYS